MNPWDTEQVPETFTTQAGYTAHVLRGPAGSLCGYVRIPEGHPLYEVSYSSPLPQALAPAAEKVIEGPVGKRGPMDILLMSLRSEREGLRAGELFDVHGSITFSDNGSKRLGEGWWYGFDCAHVGDLCPKYDHGFRSGDEVYRTLEYVKGECESLARQLKDLEALTS